MTSIRSRQARTLIILVVSLLVTLGGHGAARVSASHPGPNGRIVFLERKVYEETYSITAVNRDGSLQRLFSATRPNWVEPPAYSPDGGWIAFTRHDGTGSSYGFDEIYDMRADGSDPRAVLRTPYDVHDVSFTRNGRILYSRDTANRSGVPYTMLPDGTDIRRALREVGSPVYHLRSNPVNGRIAFYAQRTGAAPAVFVANYDGSNARRIFAPSSANGTGEYQSKLDWSPNGRRLVLVRQKVERYDDNGVELTRPYASDIVTVNADGTGLRKLTNAPRGVFFLDPVWSPDGRFISYTRDSNLWRMNAADGSGKVLLRNGANQFSAPAWGSR